VAARPRERATKAERGAGSAAAVPRSGAALDSGVGSVTLAKACRLLKAIMGTAVDDGAIRRNPCRLKGGGQESSPERPVLTVAQVFDLAEAISGRCRALVLLGSFGSLRWGELAALRHSDIDLAACTVRIERTLIELQNGQLIRPAEVSRGAPDHRLSRTPRARTCLPPGVLRTTRPARPGLRRPGWGLRYAGRTSGSASGFPRSGRPDSRLCISTTFAIQATG
jgi:hypothetical protein